MISLAQAELTGPLFALAGPVMASNAAAATASMLLVWTVMTRGRKDADAAALVHYLAHALGERSRYGDRLELSRSELGGLRASLVLPAA